jgi:hypothetical protein
MTDHSVSNLRSGDDRWNRLACNPPERRLSYLLQSRFPRLLRSSLRELRELILSCGLDDGAFMPSDRVLVEQPQTSRATVREALRILDEIQI